MKKILYLLELNRSESSIGVINKVLSQSKCFQECGYELKIFTYCISDCVRDVVGVNHICLYKNKTEKSNLLLKYKLLQKIEKLLKEEKPDIIYIRDTLFYFNFHSILSHYAPTFIEIQTNVLSEIKLTRKKRYYIEKILKRRYLRSLSGLVCITQEIANIEKKYNNKPTFIIGNGIDKDQISFIKKDIASEYRDYINLLFIGSPNMPWHGIERLIDSFKFAKNKDKFMLHIVGYENIFNILDDNIKFYGLINDKNMMDKLFAVSDIGIGTLALYKKNMNQAAALKIRHYLAKGLPVIIGYDDVDLQSDLPFVLKVANDESLLSFQIIEEFHYKSKLYRENGHICKYVNDNLCWNEKIKKLIEFIEKNS